MQTLLRMLICCMQDEDALGLKTVLCEPLEAVTLPNVPVQEGLGMRLADTDEVLQARRGGVENTLVPARRQENLRIPL